MNKNEIVKFDTGKVKGLFVSVPYSTKPEHCVFGDSETLLCAYSASILRFTPIAIPKGSYKIVGLSNSIKSDFVIEYLQLSYSNYLELLYKHDIVVNYSDTSNFWLILVSED